jgi:hypothetical protein
MELIVDNDEHDTQDDEANGSVTTPHQIWHPGLSMQLRLCNKLLPSKKHLKHFSKGGITVKADSQLDLDKKYCTISINLLPMCDCDTPDQIFISSPGLKGCDKGKISSDRHQLQPKLLYLGGQDK